MSASVATALQQIMQATRHGRLEDNGGIAEDASRAYELAAGALPIARAMSDALIGLEHVLDYAAARASGNPEWAQFREPIAAALQFIPHHHAGAGMQCSRCRLGIRDPVHCTGPAYRHLAAAE